MDLQFSQQYSFTAQRKKHIKKHINNQKNKVMKISELPTAIRKRAERYRQEQDFNTGSDSILMAFKHHLTEEYKTSPRYWMELHNAKEFFTIERNE